MLTYNSYVWGKNVAQAKTQCERYVVHTACRRRILIADDRCSLDYIFQLAVEMHKLGLPWTSN